MFDESKYFLGFLCKNGHDYEGTGLSLRSIKRRGCLECYRARTRQWKAENKDKVSEYNAMYHRANLEYQHERKRRHRLENHEAILAKEKKYREQNKEKRSQQCKDWYYRNRERRRLYRKAYYSANAERFRAYGRIYGQKNRDRLREYEQSRYSTPDGRLKILTKNSRKRARRMLVHQHPFTAEEVEARLDAFDHACAYCGSCDRLSLDHFLPLAKGGSDAIGNIIPACKRCNSSKIDKDPKEWFESQPFYSRKRWRKVLAVLGKTDRNYNQLPLI